jgi:glycosyltransferase involved in cell wall biosynthesis
MIVTFNKFEIKEEKALGGNLAYYELSSLLEKQKVKGIKFIPHKIEDLIVGKAKLPDLKEKDVLVCTISSLAWFYYYLREKEKKSFRIIHYEVTALFSDNFLQEQLCSNYMRRGDRVIFLSGYHRKLFIKLFPHLNKENTDVCLPMFTHNFPEIRKRQKNQNELTLGFIGNVSREKNFEQAIEVFIEVSKRLNTKVKMLVCGPAEEKYMPQRIKEGFIKSGIDPENYVHINNGKRLPYNELGKVWEKIDILLFPSVCGEPLGRVVLEANKLGIPVIAANHAAMPELLPKENLVSVEYYDKEFNSHQLQAIGKVDVREMTEKCCNYKKLKLSSSYKRYEKDKEKLISIIKGNKGSKDIKLDSSVKEFIQNFSLFLSGSFNKSTEQLIERAVNFLQDYITKNSLRIIETKTKMCEALSYFPHFTIR